MSGIDLVREIQMSFPRTRCILMSGGTDFGSAAVLKQLQGLILFATSKKPFDLSEMRKVVVDAFTQIDTKAPTVTSR